MQELFKSPILRSLFLFVALILVSLAIWFIGPLLSFDELHPLLSTTSRFTLIALILMLVILWLLEWNLSPIGVSALCSLVWYASPLLAFAGVRPFDAIWARIAAISLIVLVYVVWAIYVLWNLIRNDEAFARKLFDQNRNKSHVLAKEDIRLIGEKARNAINHLRKMHFSIAGDSGSIIAGIHRLMEGKRYLYELPWFVFIGNSGAGKTSILMNSGLKFPVGDQMGLASAHLTSSRDTGTQNCTWWFTNDAVLVDTAGRYTASDSFQANTTKCATAHLDQENTDTDIIKSTSKPIGSVDVNKDALNRAEWLGFLGVLRQVRPRAPINGALLTIDVSELLLSDSNQRQIQATHLRLRLEELRQHLGIRFPVYVILTKADRLRGFVDYFSSLTSEGRAQVWGFTLPWLHDEQSLTDQNTKLHKFSQRKKANLETPDAAGSELESHAQPDWPLAKQISHEINLLLQRISDGVAILLQEEFDEDRRQSLYLLPHELKALAPIVEQLLQTVFIDSRYDTTQRVHSLRGVYFTSAMQHDHLGVTADKTSVVSRLYAEVNKIKELMLGRSGAVFSAPSSIRSYFVTDLLTKVIFPEANLVRPNMRWEARYHLLRLLGHSIVLLVFFGIASGFLLSYKNNQLYLNEISAKTKALTSNVTRLFGNLNNSDITSLLGSVQALPSLDGLNLSVPPISYQFGLYAGEAIQQSTNTAYGQLQDKLILPVIIERMEYVMRAAMRDNDTQSATSTLRAYLLLHDVKKFNETSSAAQELHNWVMHDWQSVDKKNSNPISDLKSLEKNDQGIDQGIDTPNERLLSVMFAPVSPPSLSVTFNNSTAMIEFLNDMFSGRRVIQAKSDSNASLVREIRTFLDARATSQRLYESAKAEMMNNAPQDFTLVRVLGPQAGTLFSRASGNSLEKGVPGIFTFEGYHDIFTQRLPELVKTAFRDDRWLMGKNEQVQTKDKLKNDDDTAEINAIAEDIRRQYLIEYAQRWTEFLEDLRIVQSNSNSGTLSFELDVLRRLAAADSPLVKLSRIVVRQTTLSRNLNADIDEKSFIDKAADQFKKKIPQVIMRSEQRMEREFVDDRFAALREVVIGQSDSGLLSINSKPELDLISSLLNEYYTVLVVADNALAAQNLPPTSTDIANKIKIEAGKLPAPFHAILMGVSDNGSIKVEQGAAAILRHQAQAQMDRLMGLMTLYVSEPCRRGIAGRYPFADSMQDASIDDFNSIFSAGSPADEFFKKNLASLVDTSVRPWRYKSPDSVSLFKNSDASMNVQTTVSTTPGPTLNGELVKLLAKSGPNPEIFNQMAQIREVFFREPEAKRMALKFSATVQSLDSNVTEAILDFDGQVQRYSHGPVQSFPINWPGPRGGVIAEISAQPRIRPDTSTILVRGPWALLRLLDRGKVIQGSNASRIEVEFEFDGRRMNVSLDTGGTNPLTSNLLKGFSCPTT